MTSITATPFGTTTRTTRPAVWRPTVVAGLAAAVVTSALAAALHAAGVSFEIDGEAIPTAGFANMVLMCVAAGDALALGVRRFASDPRRTFVRTTVGLTVLSFVPDLTFPMDVETRCSLIALHVVAAAIVIPAMARALGERR
ncbi:DUF6069 family protein [Aeromicrobium terrae]|uniref:Cell envelope biogenesis protein OmpA n=1 Tax=Aeromicrobium terrae TaxID=2498846 RepID=A0A5C8NJE4_9ACTN|nr:DUF6069 family protein [Aeromicrobium terrae]TXL61310.1 hypothetical protein FHP06_07725 [Aeromicrobium terrae]